MINRIVPMASPFGNYFAVWRDFGCGKDPADACRESASRETPILIDWISKRLLGCPDAFGFGSLNLFFCAAL